jgi:hypothetical protein
MNMTKRRVVSPTDEIERILEKERRSILETAWARLFDAQSALDRRVSKCAYEYVQCEQKGESTSTAYDNLVMARQHAIDNIKEMDTIEAILYPKKTLWRRVITWWNSTDAYGFKR